MAWNWDAPPGVTTARATVRKLLISLLVGVFSVGAAWAGTGLVPVDADRVADTGSDARTTLQEEEEGSASSATASSIDLQTGQLLAGSAKISMEPSEEYHKGNWETDYDSCRTFDNPPSQATATHVVDTRVKWHENPNCLYMGGYGLGPVNPITTFEDPYGLWIRSVALSDGEDMAVFTLLDAAYYEGKFTSMCNGAPLSAEQDCGFMDLQASLGEELGIDPSGLFFSFTHSHTAPEFIGAWGGVPNWYMQQIEDSIRESVRTAVATMRPAVMEVGEVYARQFSNERRTYYRAAEEPSLTWFRLIDAGTVTEPICVTPSPSPEDGNKGNGGGNGFGNQGKETPSPAPSPTCTEGHKGDAIATVGSFAAHPTTEDVCIEERIGDEDVCTKVAVADADFPAVFAKAVEDKWGGTDEDKGVGMLMQTGFGNMTSDDGGHPHGDRKKERVGFGLASLIPDVGGGQQITNPDIRSGRTFWDHPVTNSVLAAGGVTAIFDREMNDKPAAITVNKQGGFSPGPHSPHKRCSSASPVSVHTAVSAAKIGNFLITAGPGELFSNFTNAIKEENAEHNPGELVMPLAVTNDGLGYIMQSFESDFVARQGTGFVARPVAEYEDAYSIDHCFGDAALEHTLALIRGL